MKNLLLHFNSDAKSKTRVQSGFQRIDGFETVPVWESFSEAWKHATGRKAFPSAPAARDLSY